MKKPVKAPPFKKGAKPAAKKPKGKAPAQKYDTSTNTYK